MATEASILAVVRASRPNFKNPNDKIAFIIHAAFLSAGYSLIATGDKAFEENPPTDGEETGIDGWNSSEDGYAFVYVKSDNGEKKSVLVKCVAIGLALVVDVLNLKDDSKEPLHIQINVKDHVVEEDKHSNYGDIYKNLQGLVQILNTGIFNKLDTKSGSCSSTSSCSKGPGENHTNNNVFPDERQQPPPVMSSRSATSSTRNIIDWNADRTNVFIDVCVQNIAARAHRVAHWYEEISATFNVRTGLNCNSGHMKNKFDNMRNKIWNAWNQLLQISGGYWNEELDTIGGSDEWWATVPSESRKYKTRSPARFRELDVMFSGCMQTDKCQFIIPSQPPVGLAFEAQIIGDYLRGDTEGISSRRGPRQHFTGASSSTSEYDLIISTCMKVQQEGDDYEEWEVAICAARCAATGGSNPLAALLHKPAQLRRTIIHFVTQFRSGN